MKTLQTLLLMVIMLTGQLSFGTGNENCCPDTTSVKLMAASAQLQLDQVQQESHEFNINLPTLENSVATKLIKHRNMLEQVQMETERLENIHAWPILKQLEVKLKLKVQAAEQDSATDTSIKL